ncbi:tyrosine-protein phosphatase [Salinimicrobium sp. TH3]|uniref:tyrosine-protein phosphatase n=1 Tax=Salinimicrobium sp. TH3 TaxID=2997342 RepID=UPI002276913D|nr:CpsB/CapC family capsule biosynthesis tyrosine phosphatase [Salinimicrobium sp. TH3]MCY2686985.1 histidinol phosphatase [Salinimicrobium sp. TH3]
MFSFFQKKYYFQDYLEDFIDIHNHILPGIDDGASTVEDSLKLIQHYKEIGIAQFITTPHVMNDYYPNTPQTINAALENLKEELVKAGQGNIKIKAAAEYMMDQAFMELIGKERLLTLKDNLVLVEMSYFQAPINLHEILFQLQTQQYKPVLAHPERYAFFHSKSLNNYTDLKNRGCLFQLNALSLVGHYGKNMKDIAFRLLKEGMIDFLGTDTHQLRHLEKLSTVQLSKKQLELVLPVINRTKDTFKY